MRRAEEMRVDARGCGALHLEQRVDDRCVLLRAEAGEERVLLGGGGDAAPDGVTLRDEDRCVVLAVFLPRLRAHAHAPLLPMLLPTRQRFGMMPVGMLSEGKVQAERTKSCGVCSGFRGAGRCS